VVANGVATPGMENRLAALEATTAELRARLSFRETMVGWLRWPLSRIKATLRAEG